MQSLVWILVIVAIVVLAVLHCVWRHYYLKRIQAINRVNENFWLSAEEVRKKNYVLNILQLTFFVYFI